LDLTAIGWAIAKAGHQIEGDSVKFLLAHCLEIYRFTLRRCPQALRNIAKKSKPVE